MESLKASLLALAAPRSGTVKLDGKKFTVCEIGAHEFAEYGALAKTDRIAGTAYLISVCLLDDDGAQLLTPDEAMTIAKSARVAMPIVNKVMELSGFSEKDEKKD